MNDRGASTVAAIEAVLANISRLNPRLNAFTRILEADALAQARASESYIAAGHPPRLLEGVPFAVKDLFDVEGLPTTAGAQMRLEAAPAATDAEGIRRLKAQGAILVGTLNMDEYAYGFATVNAHFGTTRNPHDLTRLAGGSSGGSAAAVAAGLVPLSLGSDTNGSIRVPASLCGVWGMRPAMGAIPLDGVFPFVHALDTIGPFARTCAELKTAYEVLSGQSLKTAPGGTAVARLGGFFEIGASQDALDAVDAVMSTLASTHRATLNSAEAARSAAFLITAAQGAAHHLATLKVRAMDYDPQVRDRLLAGALVPSAVTAKAVEFAQAYRGAVMALLDSYDVLLAPATPVTAPRVDETTIVINGTPVSARANLGIYAQAVGLAGPVVISAPVARPVGALPIGVQFITAPGREARLFALLETLESQGVLASAPIPESLAA